MKGILTNSDSGDGLTELLDRFRELRQVVAERALAAGREPEEVRIVAVTKGVALHVVQAAHRLGVSDFGENRVQEARLKVPQVAAATWHGIGRLQTNKASWAVRLFSWIHSVDREELVGPLARAAAEYGCRPRVLVEVLTAADGHKGGVVPQRLPWLLEAVGKSGPLELAGLMTVASRADPEACFARLKELQQTWVAEYPGLRELSMGMSDDFGSAIRQGATMIRIGRALFGPRDAN